MACKITVCTQAYNSEEYIEQCIKSVLDQSFIDFEYFIIDNGSTDKTKEIIEKYSKIDKRIHALRFEENQRGCWFYPVKENAKGKYLTTIDSDDFWDKDYLSELYCLAEKYNLDIAIGGSRFHYMNNGSIGYRKSDKLVVFEKDQLSYYFDFLYQFIRPIWGKLFKTKFIYKINFDEIKKLVYGGDTIFCMRVLRYAQNIGISNKVLYNYRVHNKSVSFNYNNQRFFSDVFLFQNAKELLESFDKHDNKNIVFLYMVYMNAIIDTMSVLLQSQIALYDKLSEVENMLMETLTQQMFEILNEDSRLKEFKKAVLQMLLEVGLQNLSDSRIIDIIYSNICLLNKNIRQYVKREEISKHIEKGDFLTSVINLKDTDILYKVIITLDDVKWTILQEIFNKNILLGWIKDKRFVVYYQDIIINIYCNNLNQAMEKIIKVLTNGDEILFEEEILFMCLNVSAILGDAGVFVYAKKLQTQLFIKDKRLKEAEKALEDLTDMCSDDEDVKNLKKWLEEENV